MTKYLFWLFFICFILIFIAIAFGEEIETLIPALIFCESGGDPRVYNVQSNAIGLLQITSIVVQEFNQNYEGDFVPGSGGYYPMPLEPIDLFNGNVNVEVGKWYLDRLKSYYIPPERYSVELLLSCWNCGVGRMKELDWNWKKAPRETRRFIKKVMERYEK